VPAFLQQFADGGGAGFGGRGGFGRGGATSDIRGGNRFGERSADAGGAGASAPAGQAEEQWD